MQTAPKKTGLIRFTDIPPIIGEKPKIIQNRSKEIFGFIIKFYQFANIIVKYIYMYKPVILLIISNIFMTFAWYGHLKIKDKAIWLIVLVSWLIALLEYCFLVPANRIGHNYFTTAQLKGMQEVITLVVFAFFSILYLKENLRWNHYVGFLFLVIAAFFIFKK